MGLFYFTKMSGAGNDFILFDKRINPDLCLNPHFISNICNRRNGIGADGVLIISDIDGYDYQMDYYNADGSTGTLCANGARCSLQYCYSSGWIGESLIRFLSNGNLYTGQVLKNELVKFNFGQPKNLKMDFKIKAANQLINSSFINTGSPHVVIKINDVYQNPSNTKSNNYSINDFPVVDIGREIRYSKDFEPDGTNVNFIDVAKDLIYIRTYERGVEDETLACGTGSVAAAIILFVEKKLTPPIKIIPKSGEELIVDFKLVEQKIEDLSLTGPAKVIFKGEISI